LRPQLVGDLHRPIERPDPTIAPGLSIVVLPFTNLSDNQERQYFADGITEDLPTDLSRIAGMLVISRNTALAQQWSLAASPLPTCFLYAAQQLMTALDRCLVIEESRAGFDAALAAGMTAICVAGGLRAPPSNPANKQRVPQRPIPARRTIQLASASAHPVGAFHRHGQGQR
jgi:hypothetical protein